MKLVYLSPIPFKSFSQRPQKFVAWCAENVADQVIWVDPYPTRLPTMSDFFRGADNKYKKNEIPNICVEKINALPIEPILLLRWLNIGFWIIFLLKISYYCKNNKVILVVAKPSLLSVVLCELNKFSLIIYDAMDDFPAFYEGISKKSMSHFEDKIIFKSKLVIASSTQIFNKIRQFNASTILIPNGLDVDSLMNITAKRKLAGKTIYGYIGTVGKWFDWGFINHIATLRPNSIIRIVGPVFNKPLNLPKNIEFIPECNHEEAINEMSKIDIALIPFLRTDLTKSVDPIKYYEYKALQLPILSTPFGEMIYRNNEQGVYICETFDEISTALDRADNWMVEAGNDFNFILKNSWNSRFNVLLEYIKK